MTSYLLDTNVVLRLIDRLDPNHTACVSAITKLTEQQQVICLAPQVLVEFWAVATRPVASNGFGWSPTDTDAQIVRLRQQFQLSDEKPALLDIWLRLVNEKAVRGKHTHDARLAAFMSLHGIDAIVTLNPSDFLGLGVTVVEPDRLASAAQ